MKKKLFVLFGLALASSPLIASAQVVTGGASSTNCALGPTGGTLFGLLCRIGELFNAVIPVLIALGVLFFVWGVVVYVIAGDEEKKKAGRDKIVYGIIGLAVIIGLWGLVNLLRTTFGLNNQQTIELPTIPVVIPN